MAKFYNSKGELQRYDPAEYLAELSFRGNLPVPLDKGGQNMVARYASLMAYNNGQPGMGGQPIDNPQLLSNLTNSDDPNRWLQYLMNRNGEEAAQANNGISGLLSSLFMSILTLAQELKQDESNDLALTEKNGQEETKEAASLRRDRESVDVGRLTQTASLNYDSELPEKQQENTIRRV